MRSTYTYTAQIDPVGPAPCRCRSAALPPVVIGFDVALPGGRRRQTESCSSAKLAALFTGRPSRPAASRELQTHSRCKPAHRSGGLRDGCRRCRARQFRHGCSRHQVSLGTFQSRSCRPSLPACSLLESARLVDAHHHCVMQVRYPVHLQASLQWLVRYAFGLGDAAKSDAQSAEGSASGRSCCFEACIRCFGQLSDFAYRDVGGTTIKVATLRLSDNTVPRFTRFRR